MQQGRFDPAAVCLRSSSGWAALALLAALLAAVVPVRAQTAPDTTPRDTARPLQGIVVRAVQPTATAAGASAVRVRLDSLLLAPAPTLDQALRRVPFVRVRNNSRGEAQIAMRGAEERQVAVLVDGVPLSLGWDHRADLSLIPTGGVSELSVVRGLASVLHGPNVLGGVVEVSVAHSERLDEAAGLRARAGLDHLGGRAAALATNASTVVGPADLRVRAGLGARTRPGLALANGIPGGLNDPDLRENSRLEHRDAFAAARLSVDGGSWLALSAFGSRDERGVPPELHVQRPRFWRYPSASRALAALSAGTGHRRTPLGEGDLEASVGLDIGEYEILSFPNRAFREPTGRESADERTQTLRVLGDHTVGRWGELRGAATLADIRHDETVEPGRRDRYRQRLWSLGTEAAWRLPDGAGGLDWLTGGRVSGGVALDGGDTPESGDKPPIGDLQAWGGRLGANLGVGEHWRVHAAASRRARFPSLRELYSGSLGRFVPNPELRPERMVGAEAGVTVQAGAAELQVVGFHQRLADAIVRTSAPGGRFRRENRDQMRSTGVEMLASGSWARTSLVLDLTAQRVRVLDPSAPSGERRPEYQPDLAMGLDLRVPLPRALVGVAELDYLGRQSCVHPDLGRDVELSPAARLDLGLERGWRLRGSGVLRRTLRTVLAMDNATDSLVYDQCGMPQPGRTLRLQLEVEL